MILSSVTERAQTTIPAGVRKALGARPGSKLAWTIEGNRAVVTIAEDSEYMDPIVTAFLGFLADDMAAHPGRISPISADLIARAKELVEGIEVDLDAPLD